MGEISTRAKERAVLGLKAGGQIPLPIIEAYLENGFLQLYRKTRMLVVPMVGIDEVSGEDTYVLPTLASGIFCELDSLYRVTLDDNGDIQSKTLIHPSLYKQEVVTDETGVVSPYEGIVMDSKSGRTYTKGLLANAVIAYSNEDYIPSMHYIDALEAIPAWLLASLASETGKPWSDKSEAVVQSRIFNDAVSRIRNKVLRGGAPRKPVLKPTGKFVI